MADNNNFSIGTGEGESPIVPGQGGISSPPSGPDKPNFGVRTMSSDMNAIKTGETPKPYTPASAPTPPPPAGMATKDAGGSSSFELPKMDFNPPATPPVIGAPGSGTSSPSPIPAPKKGGRGVFVGIITVIIVIGLAVLGYFVIYPMFFATPTPQPAVTSQTTPTPQPTTPMPVETSPTPATPTSTEATTTATAVQPHVSLFKTPADANLTATTVTTGATLAGLNIPAAGPQLIELAYQDQNGNSIGFYPGILNGIFHLNDQGQTSAAIEAALNNVWDDQKTAGFVYVDASGTRWLGFITAVNSSSSLAAVKSAFASNFETAAQWQNVFAADPGTPNSWRTGSTSGVANRYLTFSSGAALNYGWSGNALVISTSYDGFKDALSKL